MANDIDETANKMNESTGSIKQNGNTNGMVGNLNIIIPSSISVASAVSKIDANAAAQNAQNLYTTVRKVRNSNSNAITTTTTTTTITNNSIHENGNADINGSIDTNSSVNNQLNHYHHHHQHLHHHHRQPGNCIISFSLKREKIIRKLTVARDTNFTNYNCTCR